jgi:16S rRNA U1498 N3-methylase RsmE
MTSDARASILAAVNAVPAGSTQNLLRAKTAIYLILSSSQYQIEQ